ncbi:MAG TPA: KpsF/GutQ family sugar-phosphate isomerase [Myxococcaceae bacterium]|nr:KpsF/GutQ family sugar-phosphate isomerase [Myxococcaceae bacterium]
MARSGGEFSRKVARLRVVESPPKRARGSGGKTKLQRTNGRDASKQIEYARNVLEAEARAVLSVRERLGQSFVEVIQLILNCPGHVVVTGIGKPGFIAQKLSATLASTGIPSLYLHPAEAVHGDLGRIARGDVVLALSNSGATEEILRLLPAFRRLGASLVAITGNSQSTLARGSDLVLDIGPIDEACPMGLVPTASSAALHAVGDALAMTLLKYRRFTSEEYALIHPGGKVGRSLMRVFEVMRSGEANPIVRDTASLSEAVVVMTNTPGRPGAASVVDKHGKLVGIFTDGDLRRMVERGRTDFEVEVKAVMCKQPRCVQPTELALTAAARMRESKVDQLPVVDSAGRAVGLLDIQDLLAARFF